MVGLPKWDFSLSFFFRDLRKPPMLLAPAALLGVRGEVWVDPDAASRCPMLTYRWIHQPGLLDLQLHSDTSVMCARRWQGFSLAKIRTLARAQR